MKHIDRLRMGLSTLLTAALALSLVSCGNKGQELRFNEDGYFKILQFSDIHWDTNSPTCEETAATITSVTNNERPDLIVITGDVVTYPCGREGWEDIVSLMGSLETPWCVTMGNHDGEHEYHGITKQEIFDLLEGKPFYIGSVGVKLTGKGNFALEIFSSTSNRVGAVAYCFDSNDYPENQKFGKYDWVHFDQIEWYRKASDRYNKHNGGTPMPSLAFFHIPLEESARLAGMPTTKGTQREYIPQGINSGLFANMLLQGDVMGIFTGHDHDNDFAGIYMDILMGYCRVSGANAYGNLTRGGRVIKLYEGKRQFDTWISTPEGIEHLYYYPSGLSLEDELSMEYLPASDIKALMNGVEYKYFEGGRLKHTDHLYTKAKLIKEGVVDNFTLAPAIAADSMGFEYNTWIDIPESGVYRFFTISDDGSKLFIDNTLVVDNDGSHGARRVDGLVALDKGLHHMQLLYFEDYMGEQLEVGIIGRNLPETLIPDEMLYIAAPH